MRNQAIRLYLYSSLAVGLLTLVWGLRSIPKQAELAQATIRESVEQEVLTLNGAVQASVQALRFRLLDVLKAEGQDHVSRAFQNSPFVAASLVEWDQSQWKILWSSSKTKNQFQAQDLRIWMLQWPLAKLNGETSFFAKIGDWQDQAYYVVLVPVRRPANTPMIGIGIFPAAQFGMVLPIERAREVRVFDDKGFALALARPAYLGASVKREPLAVDILELDELVARRDFKNAKGEAVFGMAAKVPGTNLNLSVEASLAPPIPYKLSSWMYLVLAALGAIGLNGFLLARFSAPVLEQLREQDLTIEALRKRIAHGLATGATPATPGLDRPALERENFIEADVPSAVAAGVEQGAQAVMDEEEALPVAPALLKSITLQKVVRAALKSLNPRIQEFAVQVAEKGLQSIPLATDALQLQTAIEEVLKNAIEAMQFSKTRWLTITGEVRGSEIELTIEDTGEGVAPENLGRIFDPFFSTKNSEGVARGLGLNVTRRVIEEMHGQVRVDSRPGAGTAVVMQWPLPDAAAGVESSVSSAEAKGPPAPAGLVAQEKPVDQQAADAILSDLDLLADDYEKPELTEWPTVVVRKPIVRTMD